MLQRIVAAQRLSDLLKAAVGHLRRAQFGEIRLLGFGLKVLEAKHTLESGQVRKPRNVENLRDVNRAAENEHELRFAESGEVREVLVYGIEECLTKVLHVNAQILVRELHLLRHCLRPPNDKFTRISHLSVRNEVLQLFLLVN